MLAESRAEAIINVGQYFEWNILYQFLKIKLQIFNKSLKSYLYTH